MFRFLHNLYQRHEKPRIYKRLLDLEPLTGAMEGLYIVETLDGGIIYACPPFTLTFED